MLLRAGGGNGKNKLCIMQRTAAQTVATAITCNSISKILLDTVVYDPWGVADLANSQINVPVNANQIQVTGHLQYPAQINGDGSAGLHLFRNGASTAEAFYHVRQSYPLSVVCFISLVAVTPWLPRESGYMGNVWALMGYQDTGGNVNVGSGGVWLSLAWR